MLPPYFTDSSHCLPQRTNCLLCRISLKECRLPHICSSLITDAVLRRSLLKTTWILFDARLRDVFAVRLPRASHLPAAFCAVPQTVTCSLPCLGYVRNCLRANIPHYKGVPAKCQVPPAITLMGTGSRTTFRAKCPRRKNICISCSNCV